MYPSFLSGASEVDLSESKRVWAKYLARYEQAEIMTALERCPIQFPKFAPTVGEFVSLLKRVPAHQDYEVPKLSHMPSDDVRAREMTKIRDLVRMKSL